MNKMIATKLKSPDGTFCFSAPQEAYLASEVDAVIKEAIKFMSEGYYGLAGVTLSSAINPPTELGEHNG